MKKYNLLSFIMPCYNSADTLKLAIDSIYNQNLEIPFEVIGIDDGSDDITEELLFDYNKKYSNFRAISLSKNCGAAIASNICVEHSFGDLIFRLDSDNILEKNSINPLVELISETECECASFSSIKFFLEHPEVIENIWEYANTNNICDLNHCVKTGIVPISSGNYMYTRGSFDLANRYPDDCGAMDTWRFGFKQVAMGCRFALLPNSYYYHKINMNGFWAREEAKGTNTKYTYELVRQFSYLFTDESNKWLFSNDVNPNFFTEIENGKLNLK